MKLLVVAVVLLGVAHHGTCQLRAQYEDPCKRRGGTSPHEEYCDKFYECVGDDEVVVTDCPNGLVYTGRNSLVDVCGYDHENDCGDRPQRNPPIQTEHCDWLYGIFGHETSCTRYWTCWNGTATEQFCIGGLLYNEESHSCDWPQDVANCQKHPLCVEDPNGNVPLGKSCERYWSCQGGYPRLMRCPATLVFDKRSRRCVTPPTDDCDVPPTEEPYVEEEQPQRSQNNRGRRPIQPAPQALDVSEDEEYFYYDEVEEPQQPAQRQSGRPSLPAGATRVN